MHEGTGIGNLRRRLQTLYGDEARLSLEPAHPGTRVRLRLPVRD
jgi:LytS/YehU family sensor histidine kinase